LHGITFEQGIVQTTQVAEAGATSFDGFLVDPTTLTDESGAEFLTEAVGEPALDEATQTIRLFLPLVLR